MEVDLKTIKDKIKDILETVPETRESDLLLIKIIWAQECSEMGINNLDSFFTALTTLKITHFESIRRCRQKWQQLCPELRGTNYKEKKAKEKIIEGDLSTLFNS